MINKSTIEDKAMMKEKERVRTDGMMTTTRGKGWMETINQKSTNEDEEVMKMTMALNG